AASDTPLFTHGTAGKTTRQASPAGAAGGDPPGQFRCRVRTLAVHFRPFSRLREKAGVCTSAGKRRPTPIFMGRNPMGRCPNALAFAVVMVPRAGCSARQVRDRAPTTGPDRPDRDREREGGPAPLPTKPGTPAKETPMADWFTRQRQSGTIPIPPRA